MRLPNLRNLGSCFPVILAWIFLFQACKSPETPRLTPFVNTFIGTGGHGHTYPGATLPFGMVQLSPDTRLEGWDGCSGYHYSDSIIYGFSHTHLSGTGVSDYGDILLMPTIFGSTQPRVWVSKFSHANESASPGYYAVRLDDTQIEVELTATERVGFHRYTFPASQLPTAQDKPQSENAGEIVLDLGHRDPVIESNFRFLNGNEIEGMRRSNAWAKDQHVYFVIRFSKPFSSFEMMEGDSSIDNISKVAGFSKKISGKNLKAIGRFSFEEKGEKSQKKEKPTDGDPEANRILVKVGISAVSIEGARKNLEEEIPDWDFDGVRKKADESWNQQLSKIEIQSENETQKRIFYSALYHSMLAPNLFVDVDGQYRGRDGEIHQLPGGKKDRHYTVFSLWDTFRATHPLFTLIEQKRSNEFIRTFERQFLEGGALPVWELSANETGCMIGYHSIPVITDAWIKGIRDYDGPALLEAMKSSANQSHLGLEAYHSQGFISSGDEPESVSKTLEYSYDDWCIAMMAEAIGGKNKSSSENGEPTDYETFIRQGQYYKNLFDPETGFFRARINGGWQSGFDPSEVNFNFTEANAWQYSAFVPQDINGLINLHGGPEAFSRHLDSLFMTSSQTTGRDQADITGLIGQYAHGNEPSHHMAYLYNFVGQPEKTQALVHRIMDEMYADAPDGLSGNEDCGQMSAWYVFSAMGFYPVTPGLDYYVIGSPRFPSVTLNLENGKHFSLKAVNLSAKNIYIQSASMNGKPWTKSFLYHIDIMTGGEMILQMGPKPSENWGKQVQDCPVSAITDYLITPSPIISAISQTFTDSLLVTLSSIGQDTELYYSTKGISPTVRAFPYTDPFVLKERETIKAIAVKTKTDSKTENSFLSGHSSREPFPDDASSDDLSNEEARPGLGRQKERSFPVTAEFYKIKGGRSIQLNSTYSNEYNAGGDLALIDYLRGGADFRTGRWQGYRENLSVVVDLGSIEMPQKVRIGFMQDIKSWIWMPKRVLIEASIDGKKWRVLGDFPSPVPEDQEGAITHDFEATVRKKQTVTKPVDWAAQKDASVRFVRITATQFGVCPPWHLGAGGKTWLFADEIIVE